MKGFDVLLFTSFRPLSLLIQHLWNILHTQFSLKLMKTIQYGVVNGMFFWAGQSQPSMMPFSLTELVTLSRCLRDACLGIIKLAYPETKTEHKEEYVAAFRSVGVKSNSQVQQCIQAQQKRWVQLFKVNNSAFTSQTHSS